MPDSTLFPAYDGSTPGDIKETGVDITDTPLEPLFGESSTLSEPGASQISEIAAPADELELGPIGESPPARDPETGQRPDRLQARIDKLTRVRYEAERENSVLNEQIAALSQGLQAANARIAQLTQPRPTSPTPGLSDPFAPAGGQPTAAPSGLDEGRLEEVLNRRLQPIVDMVQNQAQTGQLRQAHEASFSEAVKDYPELARPDSEFRQEFNKLFDKSPLKALPDAPLQIALQVRGLLADARKDRQNTQTRKVAAGVSVPTQPTGEFGNTRDVNGVPASEWATRKANLEKVRQGIATQAERMQIMRVNQFLHNRKG